MARTFLQPGLLVRLSENVRQKPNLPTWKGNSSHRCPARAYNSASALLRVGRCAPVRIHRQQVPKASSLATEYRRPRCKQDECTVLYRLAVQYEALVILLQENQCTCADKLKIKGFALAGSSLSRKHGLATFVHDQLKWTLVDQSPTTVHR